MQRAHVHTYTCKMLGMQCRDKEMLSWQWKWYFQSVVLPMQTSNYCLWGVAVLLALEWTCCVRKVCHTLGTLSWLLSTTALIVSVNLRTEKSWSHCNCPGSTSGLRLPVWVFFGSSSKCYSKHLRVSITWCHLNCPRSQSLSLQPGAPGSTDQLLCEIPSASLKSRGNSAFQGRPLNLWIGLPWWY